MKKYATQKQMLKEIERRLNEWSKMVLIANDDKRIK
jgi:hypothetical protein